MKIFAQETDLGTISGDALGPFGNIDISSPKAGLAGVTGTVSAIIGVMTAGAVIWFLIQFLVGGLFWITSAGDKAKLHEARERITNAFIGLLIVVIGWGILALAGQFLGFEEILLPESIIEKIKIN